MFLDTYTHCTITCIRSTKESHNDDVITIKPFLECKFDSDSNPIEYLTYTVSHRAGRDHSPEGTQYRSVNTMDKETLLTYIDTLLELLYYDEDPFETIQIDIPSFPSILIRTSNLDLVQERILMYFKQITKSPTTWSLNTSTQVKVETKSTKDSRPPRRKEGARQHLFFDEDDNIAECNHYEF
jgi:hypothetical protein